MTKDFSISDNNNHHRVMTKDQLNASPFEEFLLWYQKALDAHVTEPHTMIVSTSQDDQPSSRAVYLRQLDNNQFIFFTNYNSDKGQQIKNNPQVALLFNWPEAHRQIRIEGSIKKVSSQCSDEYFHNRGWASKIASAASQQSQTISSRSELEESASQLQKEYPNDKTVPRPDHWGGYAVTPHQFNFLVRQDNRLHDVFTYKLNNNDWSLTRVSP